MPDITDEEEMLLIGVLVKEIMDMFIAQDVSVSQSIAVFLSIVSTAILANNVNREGQLLIAQEFEDFVTYLRTGIAAEGTSIEVMDGTKPASRH